MTYDYTTLGEAADPDEGSIRVEALAHTADDDHPAQYELKISGSVQFDLADPDQRDQVMQLIHGLVTAIAHGECVGWMGVPAAKVTVPEIRPEWEFSNGRTTVKVENN